MFSKVLLCLVLASVAYADDFNLEEQYGEARLLDSVFNNTGELNINSILALILVGILALITLGPNFLGGGSSYDRNTYGYDYQDYQDYYNHGFQKRTSPVFEGSDVASKMAQLETAFKKYQVAEAECEMYIACESSQVHRIEENGPLAKIVFDILSTFNRARDGHKWDSRMEGLVQAFEYGTGAYQQGQVDACQPLRTKCFELKKAY